MPDQLPPPRYRIIERRGRLEVIDRETGARPASAAERMAAHDATHGHAAMQYDRLAETAEPSAATLPLSESPEPVRPVPTDAIRDAITKRANPWSGANGGRAQLGAQSNAEAQARPKLGSNQASARPAPRANRAPSNARMPFVTGKWWDSKGPRAVDLGQAGRAKLSGAALTTVGIAFFVMIALMVIQPALLLVAAFALFRFGGTIIGPIGARLIDDAIKADASGR